MINGQEAELTIIDIPYVEMSVSKEIRDFNMWGGGVDETDVVSFY